ncbi:MAG: hypothetical protein PVF45_07075 [Anaerolineae bacterium]
MKRTITAIRSALGAALGWRKGESPYGSGLAERQLDAAASPGPSVGPAGRREGA